MDHVRTAMGALANATATAMPSSTSSAATIAAAGAIPTSRDFLSLLKDENSRLETTLGPEANDSEYFESAIFIDDVVLQPLSGFDRSSLASMLNNTYNYQLDFNSFNNINDTVSHAKGFVNDNGANINLTESVGTFIDRTVSEIMKSFSNESNRRNFDFLASSLYNYNIADLLSNGTGVGDVNSTTDIWNRSDVITIWDGNGNSTWLENVSPMSGNYWALLLVIFPFLTLFGNVLVILAVVRERTLQTATNYFIVSLALADLLVAVLVMPFAVYVLVNGAWSLPAVVCDFYIAMDVTCSTSSIFNLVAISIDRYIAVTQPIKYAKHKNTQRVWSTIALVWVISAAIGSPIVLGLNNTPDRKPDLCLFYNSDFIIYSSLSSFYIPCIIMVFLYYNIFKALRNRARKAKATRKPNACEILPGSVIENVVQTRRLAETTLGEPATTGGGSSGLEDERPTNTGSGSNETYPEVIAYFQQRHQRLSPGLQNASKSPMSQTFNSENKAIACEDEGGERSPGSEDIKELGIGVDECEVIPNDKSTEFILSTVVEEASASGIASFQPAPHDRNGNNDSGYGPSNLDEAQAVHASSPHHNLPRRAYTVPQFKNVSPARERPLDLERSPRKDQKSSMGSRFTIYKVNKASKKKREKSSAKKERKATKTLAIVLGVFLVCWVPFFTCNILDALCTKLSRSCQPGVAAFILTTWLGYFNSFVNPVIYTIFNPEFRKAFKKIMRVGN